MKMLAQPGPILAIGTRTRWGRIDAIVFIGERFYMITGPCGAISLLPASVVEDAPSTASA